MINRLKIFISLLFLLPGVSAVADISVATQSLRLQFGSGGDLLTVQACYPGCAGASAKTQVLSSRQGMLVFDAAHGLNGLRLERRHENAATVLDFSNGSGKLFRRWRIPDQGWMITLDLAGSQTADLQSGVDFRPRPSSGFGYLLEQTRYLIFAAGGVEIIGLDDAGPGRLKRTDWFGFRNRFWTVMLKPNQAVTVEPSTGAGRKDARITMTLPAQGLQRLELYLGPIEPSAFKHADPELEGLMYAGLWFWLRWICQALYLLLNAIAVVVPDWALAVMVMSLLVNVLMRPLSKLAERLQQQVQQTDARLQPRLKEIKKNYRGAQQSENILALYKSEGVHPLYSLKSLAGVAVVIPVFIGAFDMLAENIHLSGETFLWIKDLAHADAFMQLPFRLPFFGGTLNLLPFIMTGFSFIASRLHHPPSMDPAQQRRQARNLVLMSLGFLVLFYTFPAGMVLYWTINNLISALKVLWARRTLTPDISN